MFWLLEAVDFWEAILPDGCTPWAIAFPCWAAAGIPTFLKKLSRYKADLRDSKAVSQACRQQDSVFHVGAISEILGNEKDFYLTNVKGTQHVIEGCLEHGVQKLVFTSSFSVIL